MIRSCSRKLEQDLIMGIRVFHCSSYENGIKTVMNSFAVNATYSLFKVHQTTVKIRSKYVKVCTKYVNITQNTSKYAQNTLNIPQNNAK